MNTGLIPLVGQENDPAIDETKAARQPAISSALGP